MTSLPPATAPSVELASDLVVHAARLTRAVRKAHPQPAGVRVLSLLDQHGALGVTALAEADRCSQPTMSGTVERLLADGWVAKRTDPDDARRSLVSLTGAGRAELARTRRANGERVAARLAAHGTHAEADLAVAVAVLRDVLTPPTDPGAPGSDATPEGAPVL